MRLRALGFFAFIDGELPGEHDGGADFALADVRIEGQGLPVGEPACGRVSHSLSCMPENRDVDAAIMPTRSGVVGHDAALGGRRPKASNEGTRVRLSTMAAARYGDLIGRMQVCGSRRSMQ